MPRHVSTHDDAPNTGLYVLAAAFGGMAAGYLLATKAGGIPGLKRRWQTLMRDADDDGRPEPASGAFEDDPIEDGWDDESTYAELEARVLEAFENDPVLAHRAIDISAIGPDAIELTGWVRRESEAAHALTIARGVPGVGRVDSTVRVRRAVGAR